MQTSVGDIRGPGDPGDDLNLLRTEIAEAQKRFRQRTIRWNSYYYTALYGAPFCSGFAAIFSKLGLIDKLYREDVVAILAGLATILTAITISGGLADRWRAAKISRTDVEQLAKEAQYSDADWKAMRTRLHEIEDEYTNTITKNPPTRRSP